MLLNKKFNKNKLKNLKMILKCLKNLGAQEINLMKINFLKKNMKILWHLNQKNLLLNQINLEKIDCFLLTVTSW